MNDRNAGGFLVRWILGLLGGGSTEYNAALVNPFVSAKRESQSGCCLSVSVLRGSGDD